MPRNDVNYLQTLLYVISEFGEMSNDVLVNLHKFNGVSPDDMDMRIKLLVKELQKLKKQYREQCEVTVFDMER